MDESHVKSILSQLGMFLIKKSREESIANDVKEWMSAWETRSDDGINVLLSVLITEDEEEVKALKNKMNEFAAGIKIELALVDIENIGD